MFKRTLVALVLLLVCFSSVFAGVKWAQDFYSRVEPIRVKDPMAAVVGSTKPGEEIFEITIGDVGMYVGHICIGVAGAYRLTQLALESLYGDEVPERGKIRVAANSPCVTLDVASYITGARAFYGCGEANKDALAVDKNLGEEGNFIMVFQREDTGRVVKGIFHKHIFLYPERKALEKEILEGKATQEQKERFWQMEQEKVRQILLASPKGLFEVEWLDSYTFPAKHVEEER
jgi:formylmethanofuran dehydrogenase subunit E